MAEVVVPMDDKEMFDQAIAPEPKVETPEAPKDDGRPRDERGRWLPTEQQEVEAQPEPPAPPTPSAAAQPPSPAEPKDDQAALVPSWRLREVNEQREAERQRADAVQAQLAAMQRQLMEQQKLPQEPIDIYANPEGAFKQLIDPIRNEVMQEILSLRNDLIMDRLKGSREKAESRHGVETVAKMETALEQAVNRGEYGVDVLVSQMRASRDPVGLAMNWYNAKTVQEQTGGDLEAYVKKRIEEALKDPAMQAKAIEVARASAGAAVGNGSRPSPIQIPQSLSSVPGSAASTPADSGGASDPELFSHAIAGMRR